MKRRAFLAALSSGLFASCDFRAGTPLLTGEILGPDMALGHALRDGGLPPPTEERRAGVAIVGAGIGGLSAAWRLARRGVRDFVLFELETAAGGNARASANGDTPYPLGAHYLPLPSSDAIHVRELLADLGVLRGDPRAPVPHFDERHLVGAPQDRLYQGGLWHEGLVPKDGREAQARDQARRFDEIVEEFKILRAASGARAFAVPSLAAGRVAHTDALDRISMRDWMDRNGLDAPGLRWQVDYGCRDDYGARMAEVSAWAALHYFACRDGAGQNADSHSVLTWPAGNGYLVERLLAWLAARGAPPPRTGTLCTRVETARGHALLDIYLARENRTVRYRVDRVIWAAPAYSLARAWVNGPTGFTGHAAQIQTSPWLVANLSLDSLPVDAGPAPLAWDNVMHDSPALGYVVATHQNIRVAPGPTVLTYYWPLCDEAPSAARRRLAQAAWQSWVDAILTELSIPHPDLRHRVKRMDLWRWPHAMPRPVPGFREAPIRALLAGLGGPLLFAHSDLSGMPLFEEANFAGVRAADLALGERAG